MIITVGLNPFDAIPLRMCSFKNSKGPRRSRHAYGLKRSKLRHAAVAAFLVLTLALPGMESLQPLVSRSILGRSVFVRPVSLL